MGALGEPMKETRQRLTKDQRNILKRTVQDAAESAEFVAAGADDVRKLELLRAAVHKVYDTKGLAKPSRSTMTRLIKKHIPSGSSDSVAAAEPQLTVLASADDLTEIQLARLQTKLQNKVNSAEFMLLTKATDRNAQINEAIINVLAVILSLKASAKVVKSVWKNKLQPMVALPAAAQNAGGAEDGEEPITRDDLLVRVEPPKPKPRKPTIKKVVDNPHLYSAAVIHTICGKMATKALKLLAKINLLSKTAIEKSPGGGVATAAFGAVVSYPVNDARPGRPKQLTGRPKKQRCSVTVVSPGRQWQLVVVGEAMQQMADPAGTAASGDPDVEIEFLPTVESVDDSALTKSLSHAPSADKFVQATPEKTNASIASLARSLQTSPSLAEPPF
jgi:hypothetical protein